MTLFRDCPKSIEPFLSGDIKQAPDVMLVCKQWLLDTAPFFVISGDNGTGKSVLACQMANAWLNHEYRQGANREPSGAFFDAGVLYHVWIDEMRTGSVYGLLRKVSEYDIIVLDDIGQRFPSDGWKEFLDTVINQRLTNLNRTILTTNQNAASFKEMFGERFLSRVLLGSQVKIVGADRRLERRC